jgi:hypothetical protein
VVVSFSPRSSRVLRDRVVGIIRKNQTKKSFVFGNQKEEDSRQEQCSSESYRSQSRTEEGCC